MSFPIKRGICFRCLQKINPKSNYLRATTFNNEKIIEEVEFHLSCWQLFNQDKVNARIMEMANSGMNLLKGGGLIA